MSPLDAHAKTVAAVAERALLAWSTGDQARALVLAGFARRVWSRIEHQSEKLDPELLTRARDGMRALDDVPFEES